MANKEAGEQRTWPSKACLIKSGKNMDEAQRTAGDVATAATEHMNASPSIQEKGLPYLQLSEKRRP